MKQRSNKLEILDQKNITPKQIKDSLVFMKWVNSYLGGTNVVLDYFDKNCKEDRLTVADLGCGSGDMPYALAKWAKRKNKKIKIIGFDTNETCIEFAKQNHSSPEITYVNYSAFEFYDLGPFDYAVSSMFFHHLPDEKIIELLKLLVQKCSKGFVINDLFRGYLPYFGVGLLSVFTGKYVVLHDSTLSVARAFKIKDLQKYSKEAHIPNLKLQIKPLFRTVMSYVR